ncbi:MAG TPA: AAA family ATPase [Thermotogota bacterium]|nr:AAA family ATPase [Thermotogota bacterium]
MLREVHARNFLLFKDVSIDFHEGYNVITGETGAGKSMFIKMLRSLFGDFKAKEMIGPFEDGFWIEALFDNNDEIVEKLKESDVPIEEHLLIKIAGTADRLTARINGSVVSSKILKDFLPKTFEIHSQNAFQNLRSVQFQVELIDRYTKEYLTELKTSYQKELEEYRKLKRLQKELPGNSSEMIRTLDFLNFQIQEIEAAALREGEDEVVSAELKALSNFEFIKKRLSQVLSLLEDIPGMPNVLDQIGDICKKIEDITDVEEEASQWLESATTAQEALSDLSRNLYYHLDNFEFDEERMAELEERMRVIELLKRKYGPELNDVLTNLEKFRKEKLLIESKMSRAETIDADIEKSVARLSELDERMFEIREQAAVVIEEGVMKELQDLKMDRVRFSHQKWMEHDFQPSGRTFLEFTASTNPGSDFLPIAKIASGGEMSRIFLAMEMVIQRVMDVPSVVFDEIDAGVGARLGDLIGRKISELSGNGVQTFVITHLPQVAAFAQRHFKVGKAQSGRETVSTITELRGKMREIELNEMYGETLTTIDSQLKLNGGTE